MLYRTAAVPGPGFSGARHRRDRRDGPGRADAAGARRVDMGIGERVMHKRKPSLPDPVPSTIIVAARSAPGSPPLTAVVEGRRVARTQVRAVRRRSPRRAQPEDPPRRTMRAARRRTARARGTSVGRGSLTLSVSRWAGRSEPIQPAKVSSPRARSSR